MSGRGTASAADRAARARAAGCLRDQGYGRAHGHPSSRRSRVCVVHRYYDPSTGQFLSRDPLVAVTGSAYGYVDGNPVNRTDPAGLCFAGVFGKHCPHLVRTAIDVVGGVSGVAVGAVGIVATAASVPDALLTGAAVGTTLSLVSSAVDAYQDCIGSPRSGGRCAASLAFLAGNFATFGVVGVGARLPEEIGSLLQLWGHVTNAFDSAASLLTHLPGDGSSNRLCHPVVSAGHSGS